MRVILKNILFFRFLKVERDRVGIKGVIIVSNKLEFIIYFMGKENVV